MKQLIFLMLVFFSSFTKAQISEITNYKVAALVIMTRIETTSIDDKAFLSFGPKISLSEKDYLSLRGHFNWWDLPSRKFIMIPELDYIRTVANFDDKKPFITNLYTGVGITPYAFSPKLGVVFYHFLAVEFGNSFEFNEGKQFPTKGFRFSFGINIMM